MNGIEVNMEPGEMEPGEMEPGEATQLKRSGRSRN